MAGGAWLRVMHGRGCVWQGGEWQEVCVAGGMCGREAWQGAYVVGGGYAWHARPPL